VILAVPARLRRAGIEIRMLIDATDPFAVVKPNPRLIKLLVRARRSTRPWCRATASALRLWLCAKG
jgi:hypothetical protein